MQRAYRFTATFASIALTVVLTVGCSVDADPAEPKDSLDETLLSNPEYAHARADEGVVDSDPGADAIDTTDVDEQTALSRLAVGADGTTVRGCLQRGPVFDKEWHACGAYQYL